MHESYGTSEFKKHEKEQRNTNHETENSEIELESCKNSLLRVKAEYREQSASEQCERCF